MERGAKIGKMWVAWGAWGGVCPQFLFCRQDTSSTLSLAKSRPTKPQTVALNLGKVKKNSYSVLRPVLVQLVLVGRVSLEVFTPGFTGRVGRLGRVGRVD